MPEIKFSSSEISRARTRVIQDKNFKAPHTWRFLIDDYGVLKWNGKIIPREFAIKFAHWILDHLEK